MIGTPAARLAALAATLEAARLAPAHDDPRLDGTLARAARALELCADELADPDLGRLGRELASGARSTRGARLDAVLSHLARRDDAPVPSAAPRRVLVVDGDAGMRRLHALTLAGADRSVVGAGSLREARGVLEAGPVDLTVLELRLPDGDGRALLGAPRALTGPVVVCTNEQDLLTRTECYALGAAAVLARPCAPEELLACVAGRLSRLGEVPRASAPGRIDPAWWGDAARREA